MLVIRVKMRVTPQNKAAFVTAMTESIPISSAFDGCIQFSLYEDMTDENALLLYEEWESQAQFDAYRESEHFAESGKVLFPLMDGKPDSAYFTAERLQ